MFRNEANKKKNNKPNFRRGEIIKVEFGINIGSELSNTHFAIVLNSDDNNSVDNITVLPLTSKNSYKRLFLDDLLKSFKYYCNKANVSKIRMYDLRHTYVATMMSEGKELYHINERIDHSDCSTTVNKYGHLSTKTRKEIVAITDKYF